MRRFIILGLLIAIPLLSNSQDWKAWKATAPQLPIDSSTKLITYQEVVNLDSTSKEQLYLRAREWFAKTYKSAQSVLQMDTKDKIVGKALFEVHHRALGNTYPSGHINYTISVSFKENRYRYEITGFNHSQYGNCEDMINTKLKIMGVPARPTFNVYLNELKVEMESLISSLKQAMNKQIIKSNKDDW